jgi:hypothetical protein
MRAARAPDEPEAAAEAEVRVADVYDAVDAPLVARPAGELHPPYARWVSRPLVKAGLTPT